MTNKRFSRCWLAGLVGVCVSLGCGESEQDARPRRSTTPVTTDTSAGGSPLLAVAGRGAGSPPVPLLPAASVSTGRLDGCTAGVYGGNYEIGFLGTGPITFTLVASEPSTSSVPCQEFCPELIVSSEGGKFSASLNDLFAGSAKLKGGLDCRTGEFRAEMVDGQFSFGVQDDPSAWQLGELTGMFTGRFTPGTPAGIQGAILCNAGVDIEGTFSVMRVP